MSDHNVRRIAVIGSGVAGLTAAYVLQRTASVTLYEADSRLGGHAHTQDVVSPSGGTLAIDTGFIVHNQRTYPTLLRLFDELHVPTQESDMSMSVRCEGCGLEYAGAKGIGGVFAQPSSLVRGRYLRMLAEVPRFHRAARAVLARDGDDEPLGTFLAKGGYSDYFISHFMIPLVSAVWSCAPDTAMAYPARYLFSFLANHGMLSITGSPRWRTVVGGSRTYVDRVAKALDTVHTSTPVDGIRRLGHSGTTGSVEITDANGGTRTYDAVVVATHPDQALRLLRDPTDAEISVLGAFRYSRNETVLHTDDSVLPRHTRARASWNYLMDGCETRASSVEVSYDMNRLQRLDSATPHIVTLGGAAHLDPGHVVSRMVYEHPIYTPESVAAQTHLPGLSTGVTAYAGAYHGWGFHEDGARSGLTAARALGGDW